MKVKPLPPDRLHLRGEEPAWSPRQPESKPLADELMAPVREALAGLQRCTEVGDAENALAALWLMLVRLEDVWLDLWTPEHADLLPAFLHTADESLAWLALEPVRADRFAFTTERALKLRLCVWGESGNA